jgi:hypothetical protein
MLLHGVIPEAARPQEMILKIVVFVHAMNQTSRGEETEMKIKSKSSDDNGGTRLQGLKTKTSSEIMLSMSRHQEVVAAR